VRFGESGAGDVSYAIKEFFYTLQGEGLQAGRAAVFCRFAGCNLWSGREADRSSAVCRFCDTDFVGADAGRFETAAALAAALRALWPAGESRPFCVLTGGEPLLQVDAALVEALHGAGFEIAIETNGTLPVPAGIDWICVSPKAGAPLRQCRGDELKVVVPQPGLDLEALASLEFRHRLLQPMDGPERVANTAWALAHCLADPRWRLSLQTHKILNIR
jgi:7-carboxy-7-deazaguanine synthase (Cx14CxxC type)